MINEFRPMNHLTSLQNFICTIGNLPTSYALSLSYEEQIWWLCDFLEKKVFPAIEENTNITEETQQAFIELQNYVTDYFNNLDVQEEINNKLDEMALDGSLINLISHYVSINSINYLSQVAVLPYRPSTSNDIGMQGGCYCGDGNIAQYCVNDTTNRLQIISLSTGEVLRETTNANFGHGNGMCFKDGYLYLSGLKGNGITRNTIYKINYNDLSDITEIDIYGDLGISQNVNLFTLTYSPATHRWFMMSSPMYPTTTVYIFNEDFSSYTTNVFDNSKEYGGAIANVTYWNGYIAILYNEGKLSLYNENFELYKNVTINKVFGSRYASEFEWLDTYNNNELIFGIVGYDGLKYGGGNFMYAKTNLFSSSKTVPIGYNANNLTNKNPNEQRIYVDNTIQEVDITRDGSREKPFTSLYEASNACLNGYKVSIIYLHGDFSTEGLYLNNCNDVKVLNWLQENESNSLIPIRDFECQSTSNIYMRYILPLGLVSVKESTVLMKFDGLISFNQKIKTKVYNTGHLIFDVHDQKLYLYSDEPNEGIIEFTKFLRAYGLAKYEINNEVQPYLSCRNIKNVFTRARAGGSDYTVSNNMQFSFPRANAKILVRLQTLDYIEIPFFNNVNNQVVNLPDGSKLTYTAINDPDDDTLVKISLSCDNLQIYDAYIVYN